MGKRREEGREEKKGRVEKRRGEGERGGVGEVLRGGFEWVSDALKLLDSRTLDLRNHHETSFK